jgi:hypothetical protein
MPLLEDSPSFLSKNHLILIHVINLYSPLLYLVVPDLYHLSLFLRDFIPGSLSSSPTFFMA